MEEKKLNGRAFAIQYLKTLKIKYDNGDPLPLAFTSLKEYTGEDYERSFLPEESKEVYKTLWLFSKRYAMRIPDYKNKGTFDLFLIRKQITDIFVEDNEASLTIKFFTYQNTPHILMAQTSYNRKELRNLTKDYLLPNLKE